MANTSILQAFERMWQHVATHLATKADKTHTHNYAGSASAGGSATSAIKLDTATAGSATKPVYFTDGKPSACTYTLGTDVPSNAVFTDTNTHYTSKNVVGASSTATANASASNGSVFLNHLEESSVKSSHKIIGGGATTVTSDANGVITISSTDNNTDTKVTSVGNHYAPSADSSATLSVDASSTTAATWNSTSLVTGVNLERDAKGHVTNVTVDSIKMPANPNSDTHYTTGLKVGASATATANAAATNGNVHLNVLDNTTVRDSHKIVGSGATTVTSDANGVITISSTDNNTNTAHSHSAGVGLVGSGNAGTSGTYNYKAKLRSETALTVDSSAATTTSGRVYPVAIDKTGYLAVNVPWTDTNTVYTHPSYTSKSSGLYKITVDGSGHVSAATAVAKSDITALGIPAQDTVYTLPAATSSALGGVKVGSNISVSSGTISLTKANVTSALGYTPPTSDTNTTYSAGTGISLSGTTFSNSGVRSITTGTTNGTISVNTNGTSANVAVKGLGSAAYTNTTAYDPAGAAADAYESAKTYALTQIETAIEGDIRALDEETLASAKSYTNTKVASYLPLSGGTITGTTYFNASPFTKANLFYNSYDTSSGGAVCLIGTVSGNIQIGSNTSGQSSSNKNVVIAPSHVLRPASNASQTLGTSSYYWGAAYVNKLYIKDPGTTTNSTTTSDTYPMLKWKADGGAVCRYKASSSSRRYKTDIIEGFTDEKLNPENLYNVKLYQYKYKDDHLEKDDQRVGMDLYGFIVEDLVEHYPSAVDLNSKGEPDDWNKTFLIPAMLKLIQNQKLEIDELREDINALNKALNK